MTIQAKKASVQKLLTAITTTPDYNDNGENNFLIDVNDDGDMLVELCDYDLILIDHEGIDIPMSVEIFQKLLKLISSIKPIPDSGGLCENHLFDHNYDITIENCEEKLVVKFKPELRELELIYTIDEGDGNIFKCSGDFFIEDFNTLLFIFTDFIYANFVTFSQELRII